MSSTIDHPALKVTDVTKKYRLGQYNADSFQEEFKLWMERRKGLTPQQPVEAHKRIEQNYLYALDNVNLTVYPGERVGIIGRNGAGKSTLLKLISRVTAPTAGKIQIWGRVASMLEVGTGFHGDMTGRENIYMNGAILGMSRKEIEQKMDDIIEFSEIHDFIDTPVKRYSSGMYVKLGFAVAAHLDSEIIIMDEVLAVGDMNFQTKCLNKMRTAAKSDGRTVLYVSHNMNTIRQLCDRCVVLDEGKIVFDGNVDRAIAIYLGVRTPTQTTITFSDEFRPFAWHRQHELRMNIDKLSILAPKPVFPSGEKVKIELLCTAGMELNRVGLRFEIWSGDGQKIGTMLSENFADLHPGMNLFTFTMDTEHLAAGQYRADLVAYLHDENGNEDILDGVYPGLLFEIQTGLNERNYLDWHHQYWGNVRLHDLHITMRE